jgi:hypothetical protein
MVTARDANAAHITPWGVSLIGHTSCQLPSRRAVNLTIEGRPFRREETPAQLTKMDPAPAKTVTGP